MSTSSVIFQAVTFTYPASHDFVFEDLSLQFDSGWTGIVGPNGAGKTTLMQLITGQLTPLQGRIHRPEPLIYCPQRTNDPPLDWEAFMQSTDASACRWRGRLQIGDDWLGRWFTLSHGQRKRIQIAMALWQDTELLMVDEPTNHIDQAGKELVIKALHRFKGVGLVVSHDRQLLDTLCQRTLSMEPVGPVLRPGCYSEALAQVEDEFQQQETLRHVTRQKLAHLEREVSVRSRSASQADRKRSKRGLKHKDHDAKAKRDLARVSGKDGQAGRQLRQLSGRHQQLQQRLSQAFIHKRPSMQLKLPSSPFSGDRVMALPSGRLAQGNWSLTHPALEIGPRDRIGLVGDNGTGKTQLVQALVSELTLPPDRYVYVPQEIPLEQGRVLVDRVRQLSSEQLGHFMTVMSCLGSDPKAVLTTDCPSPGELRKLMLAAGTVQSPYLIIMDEPTNHLDLPSIQALERALDSCECALILVSHDAVFLQSLVNIRWSIQVQSRDASQLHAELCLHTA